MLDGRQVIWDITYACPLRCKYCYSESGRRAARTLNSTAVQRVIDVLISAKIGCVHFAGGEPTLVDALVPAARTLRASNVYTTVYTGGHDLDLDVARELVKTFNEIHVSIDGAFPATHDRLRGRTGSFDRALATLELLFCCARELEQRGEKRAAIGLDFTVTRSNVEEIEPCCKTMSSRFKALDSICFGVAIPSGLATRQSFAETELLTNDQVSAITDARFIDRLRCYMPAIGVCDNWHLLPRNPATLPVQIEPDGCVRAFPIYEGTVGNLLSEPLETIWERAEERHRDPGLVDLLSRVSTLSEWAAVARLVDQRFASESDLKRIRKRSP